MNKLKMFGHVFKVNYLPTVVDNGIAQCGLCDNGALTIEIALDIPISLQQETLLHEVMEAINTNLELNLPHNAIQAVAITLRHIFKDNPQLIKEIL